MAVKKIKLDFSKVEERSGWNTRAIPEGLTEFKIESVQETEAGDGTDMLVYGLRPTNPKYKTRLFPFYCKLQQNQYWKLRDLLVAAGVKVPARAGMIDPNAPVGKIVAGEVEDETGQYAGRSSVNGIYDRSLIEDDGPEPDDEDDEDEDEPDEDDEEDEGLAAMTLPQLKKLAKELGITGYTKMDEEDLIEAIEEAQDEAEEEDDDLDEDDLDDDELDEDDFEDDEEDEEPEPAPRRRTASKPAARPAARKPAAKAAPAKRVVRR